ncbi:hypothetical protein Naga_100865g2 [Nannochloropsis gaditana]|uniref:Uncharacterized protein n=1 Tax=Nannochloropsis gaditana TaxID=72520 RepID=W7T9Z9_9STRA|nr:hypothetical protein Naga_100865g2 [Nannochloropsis gaditana]
MSSCPQCYVGQCRKHKLQDHGARERALLSSRSELQRRLYESLVQPHVDTLKTTKKATAEAEAGHCRYRDAVGKDREKAQRQKSKFSEEQVRKAQALGGLRGDLLRTMLANDSDFEDGAEGGKEGNTGTSGEPADRKKKRRREAAEREERKARKKKKKALRKEEDRKKKKRKEEKWKKKKRRSDARSQEDPRDRSSPSAERGTTAKQEPDTRGAKEGKVGEEMPTPPSLSPPVAGKASPLSGRSTSVGSSSSSSSSSVSSEDEINGRAV